MCIILIGETKPHYILIIIIRALNIFPHTNFLYNTCHFVQLIGIVLSCNFSGCSFILDQIIFIAHLMTFIQMGLGLGLGLGARARARARG